MSNLAHDPKSYNVMISKKYLVFSLVLCLSYFSIAQEEKDYDFKYSISEDIGDETGYMLYELTPLNLSYGGGIINFGFGTHMAVSDIKDVMSIDFDWNFNHTNKFTRDETYDLSVPRHTKTFTGSASVVLGFRLKKSIKTVDRHVNLEKSGNVYTNSNLPVKIISRYEARLGIGFMSNLSKPEIPYVLPVASTGSWYWATALGGDILVKQNQIGLSFGIRKKTSANTIYVTDNFGTVTNSFENSEYFDIILGLRNEFPRLYHILYQDQSHPNEMTSQKNLTSSQQALVENEFNYLPVGARVGWTRGSRKKHGFSYKVQGTILPGFYTSPFYLLEFQAGISYRFLKEKK